MTMFVRESNSHLWNKQILVSEPWRPYIYCGYNFRNWNLDLLKAAKRPSDGKARGPREAVFNSSFIKKGHHSSCNQHSQTREYEVNLPQNIQIYRW